MSEKLCLQWNDFKDNVILSFGSLREDKDFADVTLVSEDGKQMEVHKVVLACSSQVFKNILKTNKHNHPLLYMRGLKSEDLLAIIDFLYCGETKVHQENLDSFLAIAEELQLKGLVGKSKGGEERYLEPSEFLVPKSPAQNEETRMSKFSAISSPPDMSQNPQARTVALASEHSYNDMQKLDEQINAMMTKTSVKDHHRMALYVCNTCGKKSQHANIRDHIEAKHLDGILVPCNFCDKMFKSRNSKATHISVNHKDKKEFQKMFNFIDKKKIVQLH